METRCVGGEKKRSKKKYVLYDFHCLEHTQNEWWSIFSSRGRRFARRKKLNLKENEEIRKFRISRKGKKNWRRSKSCTERREIETGSDTNIFSKERKILERNENPSWYEGKLVRNYWSLESFGTNIIYIPLSLSQEDVKTKEGRTRSLIEVTNTRNFLLWYFVLQEILWCHLSSSSFPLLLRPGIYWWCWGVLLSNLFFL